MSRYAGMPRTRAVHRSRRLLIALGALLAAVLIGVVVYLASGGDDAPPPRPPPQRSDVLPRGDTPAESARLLADWLREKAG